MCYLVVVGCLGTAVSPAALDYHQSLPNSHLHHHNLHRDNVSLYFDFFTAAARRALVVIMS